MNKIFLRLLPFLLVGIFACRTSPNPSSTQTASSSAKVYYPEAGDKWERRSPRQVGLDPDLLAQAVAYAQTQETKWPKDFSNQEEVFGKLLGPIPPDRAGSNGMILRHGYIVAEWGDTRRADPTYSVAKSFLSTLLGITLDQGMIKDIHDPVSLYIQDGGYESERNRKVTWHHHAQQTSEWEGELFGKTHTFVGKEEFGGGERKPRELQEPGTYYEYNDVRINRLALSLLRLWKKPLPEVLKEQIMDPIGASNTWQYHPYRNSWVEVDGKRMPSVSGGTRWGGGLWINTRDEARFGYLFLRQGKWKNEQLVSEQWVQQATTPGPHGPDYGYLWWLNTQQKQWPDAPASSYAALGAGSNTIWIDPEHDLVVVWRWHQTNGNEFFKRLLAAVKE
jgi:CubicO group peptidase (beta-lactamase class C family)